MEKNIIKVSDKGKLGYTDKEEHSYHDMGNIRRKHSLPNKQESKWKRKGYKISLQGEMRKKKQTEGMEVKIN